MKLSEVVMKYRKENGLSQREFAKRCGLSNSYISFIEKECNPTTKQPIVPSIEQYKKMSNAMGLTIHQLFEVLDDDSPVDISAPFSADSLPEDEKQLLILWRGADDRAREDAIRTLSSHQKKDTTSKMA